MEHSENSIRRVVSELIQLGTAGVCDRTTDIGLIAGLNGVATGACCAGPVLPVQGIPGDNSILHVAIESTQEYSVLVFVVDDGGECAYFGATLAGLFQEKGASAAVILSSIRDISGIRDLGFPTYYRELDPRRPARRGGGHIGPIEVNGMVLDANNWVVCDGDGVIAIEASVALAITSGGEGN